MSDAETAEKIRSSIYAQHGYAVAVLIQSAIMRLGDKGWARAGDAWARAGDAEIVGQAVQDLKHALALLEPMARCPECALRHDEAKAKREAFPIPTREAATTSGDSGDGRG